MASADVHGDIINVQPSRLEVLLDGRVAALATRLGQLRSCIATRGEALVEVSRDLGTPGTSHRSLYVGATRGRDHNHLLVVTDTDDLAEARDVLESVLTNDRSDVPTITQRRRCAGNRDSRFDRRRPRRS